MGTVQEDGVSLPVGIQIMCQQWQESKMFHIASVLEKALQIDGASS